MSVKVNIVEGTVKKKKIRPKNDYTSMEAVHHPAARPWISQKFNLDQHFNKYSQLVSHSRCVGSYKPDGKITQKKLRDLMEFDNKGSVSNDIFEECARNCKIENFTLSNELEPHQQFTEVNGKFPRFAPTTEIPQSGIKNLKTLELQQEFIEKANEYERFRRMRGLRNPNNAHFEAAPPPPTRLNMDLLDKEIIVACRVYRPIKTSTKSTAASMTTANRFVQEIHLLGSNTLGQLRDLIKCSGDFMVSGDVSEKVRSMKAHEINQMIGTSGNKRIALEKYKSAFFFIEDCFYNDTRWEDCKDLSQVIRDWAEHPSRGIGPFRTAVMQDTKIRDLNLRLGYPYVYVHLGDHEHLISFVSAKLLSADDIQKPSSYPYERSTGMVHSKMCMVCNTFIAKWITTNNERVKRIRIFFFSKN